MPRMPHRTRAVPVRPALVAALLTLLAVTASAQPSPQRPFGTVREQAELQQAWLAQRLDTILPALLRKHGIDMWVVPMREYNEDPVFTALVAPETFAARRRTIYVFFDSCAAANTPPGPTCLQRIALGGTSTVFAFSDGLSSGELHGMSQALGEKWTSRFKDAERLPLELIAARLPGEEAFFTRMQTLVWAMTEEMFSARTITPGTTRTSDLVWWWRQRVNDLGLGTWFQPSVDVQRRGVTDAELGADPIIQRGDVLHCDVGITVARLNTDTQHLAYVVREGETDAPAGLKRALANANAMQDITLEELRPGRTGNAVLAATLARMRAKGIDGSQYSHPIGLHGHGAGPLIGLWDYQAGVPGRGDAVVIPGMWYSVELQATTPVAEWGGQPVRMAQEEDVIIGADGRVRWALKRQDRLFLVK
jgi:Xaa-Pro aminopeptidase